MSRDRKRILVAPEGSDIFISQKEIRLPAFKSFQSLPAYCARKRAGEPGSLWRQNFMDELGDALASRNIMPFNQFRSVKGPFRFGVKVWLCLNGIQIPVLIEYDGGHPICPHQWALPGGLIETASDAQSIPKHALQELAEELLPVYEKNGVSYVGSWRFGDRVFRAPWLNNFCRNMGFRAGTREFVLESVLSPESWCVSFGRTDRNGGDGTFMAQVMIEPSTGSIEFVFSLKAELPSEVRLLDGEVDHLNQPLQRNILDPRSIELYVIDLLPFSRR